MAVSADRQDVSWRSAPETAAAALTLARTGGGVGATPPPLRFFADSEKTAAHAPPGCGVPYGANLAQLLVKKIDQVRSGHGAMTS